MCVRVSVCQVCVFVSIKCMCLCVWVGVGGCQVCVCVCVPYMCVCVCVTHKFERIEVVVDEWRRVRRVSGLGFRILDFGFRVSGLGCKGADLTNSSKSRLWLMKTTCSCVCVCVCVKRVCKRERERVTYKFKRIEVVVDEQRRVRLQVCLT